MQPQDFQGIPGWYGVFRPRRPLESAGTAVRWPPLPNSAAAAARAFENVGQIRQDARCYCLLYFWSGRSSSWCVVIVVFCC